jgi:hypothetical protein
VAADRSRADAARPADVAQRRTPLHCRLDPRAVGRATDRARAPRWPAGGACCGFASAHKVEPPTPAYTPSSRLETNGLPLSRRIACHARAPARYRCRNSRRNRPNAAAHLRSEDFCGFAVWGCWISPQRGLSDAVVRRNRDQFVGCALLMVSRLSLTRERVAWGRAAQRACAVHTPLPPKRGLRGFWGVECCGHRLEAPLAPCARQDSGVGLSGAANVACARVGGGGEPP